nr:hypothetical protein [Tanacetum cinerariifolium]
MKRGGYGGAMAPSHVPAQPSTPDTTPHLVSSPLASYLPASVEDCYHRQNSRQLAVVSPLLVHVEKLTTLAGKYDARGDDTRCGVVSGVEGWAGTWLGAMAPPYPPL